MLKKIIQQLNKDSKWNLLLFIVPFIIYFSYKIYEHSFVKEGNYTIGYIDKVYWSVISHKKISYSYKVNRAKYRGVDIYNSYKKPIEGKRYLIRFSNKNPKQSDIFQDIFVPDSVKSAPPNGWKELPNWAKK